MDSTDKAFRVLADPDQLWWAQHVADGINDATLCEACLHELVVQEGGCIRAGVDYDTVPLRVHRPGGT